MSRRKSQVNLDQTMKIDVLIIGGGPGGSAAAMFLLREGIKPVILEQEEFPRFHIGESLTGEGGQVLRRLRLAEKMDAAGFGQIRWLLLAGGIIAIHSATLKP